MNGKRDFTEWLRREIPAWRTEGLIDGPAAERLLARYSVGGDARRSLGVLLIGVFGALLIGLGVIALLAANWDCFGRSARAAISIAPTAVCGICALAVVRRGVRTAAFWEPLSLLWTIAIVAGTSLVAQTYQIGGNVSSLVLLVALLALPIAWFVPAAISRILWLGFPLVWTLCRYAELAGTEGGLWGLLAGGLLLTAASMPGYALFLRGKPGAKSKVFGQTLSGLAYSVGTAIIVNLVLFRVWSGLDEEYGVVVGWIFAALLLAVAIVWKLPVWPYVCTFVSVCGAAFFGFSESLPFYCSALVLAATVVWWGVRALSIAYTNLGAALLLILILCKFFARDLGFTEKGIISILCGVALTAFNVFFVRYCRKRRPQ